MVGPIGVRKKLGLCDVLIRSCWSHLANVFLDPLWHRQVTAKVMSVPWSGCYVYSCRLFYGCPLFCRLLIIVTCQPWPCLLWSRRKGFGRESTQSLAELPDSIFRLYSQGDQLAEKAIQVLTATSRLSRATIILCHLNDKKPITIQLGTFLLHISSPLCLPPDLLYPRTEANQTGHLPSPTCTILNHKDILNVILTVFCGHTGHTTGQTSFLKCTAPQFAFFAIQISPLYLLPLSNLISTEIKIHINQWQVNSSWTITNCPKTMPVNLRIDRQYKLCIQSSCWLFVFFGREFCNKSNVSVFQAMRIFLWLGPPHGKGLVVVAEPCHRIFVVFLDRLLGQTSLLLLPHCSSPNRSLSFSVFALEEGVVFQFLQNVHLLSF